MAETADDSNDTAREKVVSKGLAKRKYLLEDKDLEGLEFKLKDNPVNKSYAPMKIFKLSEVESVAISKWESMEKLEAELEKRRQQGSKLAERKEEEKRHFWNSEELYEPLKPFMENIELPSERVSSYFKDKRDRKQANESIDSLLECDVILCFCDCLHSIPPDSVARQLLKNFPEARQVDRKTPYNERRKMGHFSWTSSASSEKTIVNLYVVHKWKGVSRRQESSSMISFDALAICLKRLSALISKTVHTDGRPGNSLNIGTYLPYRVDSEMFKRTLEETMEYPVKVYTITNKDSSSK
ncbi:uncharacterized protein LOC111326621 [Stylophora pistillata]|uniref:XPA C-terminal domain-containing protein n=1 Tax=Stylophora pistillata TaxID=50429 RepID=A0A2B4SHR6_STYPI|nr:uncharacterized protein LOC111326621 [Stylophora pistillata]PFX28118.1 hypothetical protein AWC38_SpisGene7154 [Stylophora pistillata]